MAGRGGAPAAGAGKTSTLLPRRQGTIRQNSDTPCKRPRCNRTMGISEFGYCSDHGCMVPTCADTKSSKEKFCEACAYHSNQPLPKGWFAIPQPPEGTIYIHEKTQVAQWLHPGAGGERAFERKSNMLLQKARKGVPIQYVIHPQPADLPDPWEVCLAVPDAGKDKNYSSAIAMQIYVNSADTRIQRSDPRPPPEDEEGPLPAGWEKCSDEGEAYYHNLNTDVLTYDDPRVVVNPHPSQYLEAKYQNNPFLNMAAGDKFGTIHPKDRTPSTKDLKQKVWNIGPCDMVAFADLDDNLTWEDEIPECVRSKVYNRYMDILPNPKTRVPLPVINSDPRTEYVNANYVRGPSGNPKHYICAMGPKPTTVDQYWRMLWQEKPLAIVMITGIVEKGQPKCERYWPGLADGKTIMSFDENRVRVVTTKSDPSPEGYVRSTIKAVGPNAKGGRESHEIEHFWYNTWPDHGVPRKGTNPMYTTDCVNMIKDVNAYVNKRNGKLKRKDALILVHCSAGIGRTGTYVCLDHSMHLLQTTNEVDCIQVVTNVRNDRCALVQHPAQYKFVHAGTVDFAKQSKQRVRIAAASMDAATMDKQVKMTEEAKKKQRAAEKQAALARIQTAKAGGGGGGGMRMRSATNAAHMTASEGELDLGFIHFEGQDYKFFDPDGDGFMDMKEAEKFGFPRKLFRLLDKDRDGRINPAEFKRFQQEQRRMLRSKSDESAAGAGHSSGRAGRASMPEPAGGWPD
eukprot:m.285279 g.285279  ORF g.285279 m.285279 type:complete len:738 (+) comp16200_c2_seq1:85-2298(+)